jgi:hypothetical protein
VRVSLNSRAGLARRKPMRRRAMSARGRRSAGPTAETRSLVVARDRGRCVACGRETAQLQHRRARGMGGTADPAANQPANLVLLCGSATTGCHGRAEDRRDPWGERQGYVIRHGAGVPAAADTPLWWHGQAVVLDDAGGWKPHQQTDGYNLTPAG